MMEYICLGMLLAFVVVFVLLLIFKLLKWVIILVIVGVVLYFLFFRDVEIAAEMIRSAILLRG